MATARHEIIVKPATKEVNIVLEGIIDDQEVQTFVNKFNDEMKKINPSDYTITFDASKFQVVTQDMIPLLEGCFKLYKTLNFKKIDMILENPILNLQIKRVAKMAGLDNFNIIR